jgi:hypothetical protein
LQGIDAMITQTTQGTWLGTFVRFDELGILPGQRTNRWYVVAKNESHLGLVCWYSPWRKFAFFPEPGAETIFEETCLHDIARFIHDRTRDRKAERDAKAS